ncbi:MAG: phosphonate ABC transporter, permease protein PhnE [Anaerolineae bacterium]|nr:phosphonate ABC transporter, permease protein PhnE [Anaerolineae bacterium]
MTIANRKDSSQQVPISWILSLLVPGAGQFYLKKYWRAISIFVSAVLLAFLVNWAFDSAGIGEVTLGSFKTSWLWLPLILFWVWNVFDARNLARGNGLSLLPAVVLGGIILYFLAWVVTDVKVDRLVSRFSDAQKVTSDLINPDIFSIDVNGEAQQCDWGCLAEYIGNRINGKETQAVRISDNIGDIFGRGPKKPITDWRAWLGYTPPQGQGGSFEIGKLIETIAIGLMATLFSTLIAIPLSFLAAHNIMSRVPGGMAVYYFMRTLLNIVRAVDTVVWGLIIIVWVGLGSFAGVIALTIHSIAALGKLYSEEIEHIDSGPIEAITASGANLIQIIRYAVIPQIVPPFLGYTLLRWDINMRSATVIGFVAGGGIGFFVLETIRMGAYRQYATALWAVAVVIIIVDYISARWRDNILKDQPQTVKQPSIWSKLLRVVYILLGIILFVYCWFVTKINIKDLLEPGTTFGRLLLDFVSIDLSKAVLTVVTREMITTILQALLATTLGAILALPFSFLAAKNLTGQNRLSIWLYYISRSLFNILRSIEALLYVAIFVFWVGIGPFAGMMALAITTFALLGKLFSEAIENIESGPIEAINATGANRLQMITYAILPQIVPPFVSYLIYQWDINIRMATIIGFAGGGGIGLTLSTFFGSLQYHKAGTVVAFIVIVVALMDFTSAKLREKLV